MTKPAKAISPKNIDRRPMTKPPFDDQCSDLTQTMTIDIPCGLAERVERYAEENETDFSGVIIEALDAFLRGRKSDH